MSPPFPSPSLVLSQVLSSLHTKS
ncbi:hypothetical protein CIB84_016147 [Bambusicola thoracicus]|uniref:Uncharacterized protein n=1 Tax=Bambusicola thoracicus TaxID=9083 RepID=A0A2P4S7N7_BAMTH|nr:hypothetical protein CIB84_016779 [Bambusicola thoracicus]POI20108.1 hypothetical protein CIB84_016146 [Bambusicola thoracicus]POI20109.1 hypothetical protein CIB84_016145 [Bambusicola thoracicus]POI20110.1 hypothetical protein CIB84_016147 [Bambusicola thoracicus]